MNIQELKEKSSEKLITEAEKLGIENASTLRRQEIYFAIFLYFERISLISLIIYFWFGPYKTFLLYLLS